MEFAPPMSPARPGVFKSRGTRADWHPLTRMRFDRGKMTQQQLAEKSGVSRTTIARVEGGKEPLVSTALRLVGALDCRVEDIWKEES